MLGIDRAFSWLVDYRVHVDVAVSADMAFDYLSDLEHQDEFVGGEVVASSTGLPQVGSGFSALVRAGGDAGTIQQNFIVTEFVPGRRLAYATVGDNPSERYFGVTPKEAGKTQIEHGFREGGVPTALQMLFLILLPFTALLYAFGVVTYRPYMSWATRLKLRRLASKIEAMRRCEACSSIYRVTFHVANSEETWLCAECASEPAHIDTCTFCSGRRKEKIEF